jgi:hypothetical protein
MLKKAKDIVSAYESREQADGRTMSLKSLYYVMNNLFRETINPKSGDSNALNKYAKNLLARMAPASDSFLVSRFMWIELSMALDDAHNGLPYASCIMFIIERMFRLIFKKDVEDKPYKLT